VVLVSRCSTPTPFAEAQARRNFGRWLGSHARLLQPPRRVAGDSWCRINLRRRGETEATANEPTQRPATAAWPSNYGRGGLGLGGGHVKPRLQGQGEVGVQVLMRWILAALGATSQFLLAGWNSTAPSRLLLARLNRRPFRKLPGSRQSRSRQPGHPALRPLCRSGPMVYADEEGRRVHIELPRRATHGHLLTRWPLPNW